MTQAIAGAASTALAVKLARMFEQDDRFLTFPAGLGFSYRYLGFMSDAGGASLSAKEQLDFRADFSRLLNQIPEERPSFQPDASRFVWDEVRRILRESVFAQSALSAEEEQQLAGAIDYLTDDRVNEDGTKVPVNSEPVNRYYEYKTQYEQAAQAYLDEKLSMEFATGPEAASAKAQWDGYREKQRRELRDGAEREWIDLGSKREVEQAQALKDALELRKYLETYRQAYLREMDLSEIADLNGLGVGFLTTFYSPSDAFEPTLPWPRITLTRAEIAGLVAEAPPSLRAMFGGDSASSDLEAISLEYNNVVVIRPWFKPEFFASRCWDLPHGPPVSSGGVPAQGTLPSVVTSMVVARNVQITRKTSAPAVSFVLPVVSAQPLRSLRLSSTAVMAARIAPAARVAPAPHAAAAAVMVAPGAMARVGPCPVALTPMRAVTPAVAPAAVPAPARASFIRSALLPAAVRGPAVKVTPAPLATAAAGRSAAPSVSATARFYADTKYRGNTIKAPGGFMAALWGRREEDPRVAPQGVHTTTETVALDGVSVLAFVCKRTPRSPDPDSSLRW